MRIFNRQTGINTPRRDAAAAKASLPLFAGDGFAQILGMVGKSGFDFGPVVDGKFACLIKRKNFTPDVSHVRMSCFFGFDTPKNVPLEVSWSPEEFAQCFAAQSTPFENESDENCFSSLKAKNILRVSVIPSFWKTSSDIVSNPWTECNCMMRRVSGENLMVQQFQVVFTEVLWPCKKGVLGFGQSACVLKPLANQLESACYVRCLEKTILGRLNLGDEFCSRGKHGKRFFEKIGQLKLSIVVVDFKLGEPSEFFCIGEQKTDNLLQQWIVNIWDNSQKVLVDLEAMVGNVGLVHKQEHATEDASSDIPIQCSIRGFSANQRSSMHAVGTWQAQIGKRSFEFPDFIIYADLLIVEDHADKIVSRRFASGLKTARFVDENANLFCAHGCSKFTKTKARIAPRLRQESFPRADDSSSRLCRNLLYHNRPLRCKGVK